MRSVSVCLIALGLCLSCGGDDSGDESGKCSGDSPCGGKLEGAWKLVDACYTVLKQPDYPPCPTATAELHAKSEGSVTFAKDSYERHLQIDTTMTLNIQAKCKQDTKRECESFGGQLGSGATLSCEDAADGGCKCTADFPATTNDSGGYTIRGNKVELVGDSYDYCVKGDSRLTLKPTRPTMMSGTTATSELQILFEKN